MREREQVLDLLFELYGEAVKRGASDERLAEIKERAGWEVHCLMTDAIEHHDAAKKMVEEAFSR